MTVDVPKIIKSEAFLIEGQNIIDLRGCSLRNVLCAFHIQRGRVKSSAEEFRLERNGSGIDMMEVFLKENTQRGRPVCGGVFDIIPVLGSDTAHI